MFAINTMLLRVNLCPQGALKLLKVKPLLSLKLTFRHPKIVMAGQRTPP